MAAIPSRPHTSPMALKRSLRQHQPLAKFLLHRAATRYRCGITVNGHNPAVRAFENGPRIAARPEGAIDIDFVCCRLQSLENFRQHDRRVERISNGCRGRHGRPKIGVNKRLIQRPQCL